MTNSDFHYAEWLLVEWARWVKSEYIGGALDRGRVGRVRLIDDETGLAVDMAIARSEEGTRKVLKRAYLWCDISISRQHLCRYLSEFLRNYQNANA